jgi:hypothetical protein
MGGTDDEAVAAVAAVVDGAEPFGDDAMMHLGAAVGGRPE